MYCDAVHIRPSEMSILSSSWWRDTPVSQVSPPSGVGDKVRLGITSVRWQRAASLVAISFVFIVFPGIKAGNSSFMSLPSALIDTSLAHLASRRLTTTWRHVTWHDVTSRPAITSLKPRLRARAPAVLCAVIKMSSPTICIDPVVWWRMRMISS